MKPKTEKKSSKVKKAASKSLKPAVSATAIKKTLKNIVQKDLLTEASSGMTSLRSDRRTDKDQGKSARTEPASYRRGAKKRLPIPNDHGAPGTSQKHRRAEKAKRQKISLLEIPKRPTREGTVFVMGENGVGQLGLENLERTRKRPAQLPIDVPIVEIAAGGMHSVCLAANGDVYTFGCNDEGALGRPQTDDDSEILPAVVHLPELMVMISAGDSHTAALSTTGKVYIWGNFRNSLGSMGLTPNGQMSSTPIQILQNVPVVKIASGAEHLVCLSADGDVYTCGCAESGQLGRISSRSASNGGRTGGLGVLLNPDIVSVRGRQKRFDNIWTGLYTTFARERNTDHIYAFGLNNHCQLGYNGSPDIARYVPKLVSTFPENTQIICGGQHHMLCLDNSGRVYAVGRKEYGRLGLGANIVDATVPTLIPSLQSENCCDISCGNCVSFAVNRVGRVFSWGMGDSCQLGHGDEDDYFVPTLIERNLETRHVFRVAGGGQHTLILAVREIE